MPVRIQRQRTKGWKMPENTVYVGRPTKWGNPYFVNGDAAAAVGAYRRLFTAPPSRLRHLILRITKYGKGRGEAFYMTARETLPELHGKNLACWCKLSDPCHADVLLELANPISQPRRA